MRIDHSSLREREREREREPVAEIEVVVDCHRGERRLVSAALVPQNVVGNACGPHFAALVTTMFWTLTGWHRVSLDPVRWRDTHAHAHTHTRARARAHTHTHAHTRLTARGCRLREEVVGRGRGWARRVEFIEDAEFFGNRGLQRDRQSGTGT